MALSNIITGLVYFISICAASKLTDVMPLIPDSDPDIYSASVGCVFGDAHYEIDSQWHPILEPYGVMYCLKCTCNAVIKKGLLQQRGQVQCRSITKECPDVSHCPNTAVLPPNSCCKVCPDSKDNSPHSVLLPYRSQIHGDRYSLSNSRLTHQTAMSSSSNDVASKHSVAELAVLLARSRNSKADIVGKAFLRLDVSVLRMTIELSSRVEVDSIRLVGKGGEILYSESDIKSQHISGMMKVCLVWREAIKHSDELKSGTVRMVITTAMYPDGVLEGCIKVVTPQVLETFSSLLMDSFSEGYAAQLSMALDLSSNDLLIRGSASFPATGSFDGKQRVKLELVRDRRVVYSRYIVISIVSNFADFSSSWSKLKTSNLKQLARGRLAAKLKINNRVVLSGPITTFHTCGGLKSLITGADAIPQHETIGIAVGNFSLKQNGRIHYYIEIRNVESKITEVVIETDRNSAHSTKITRLAKDINDRSLIIVEGTYDKPDAREIQLLLQGGLFVNVETRLRPAGALRGQILLIPTEKQDYILLRDQRTGMAAQAWCQTGGCSLVCNLLVPRVSVQRDGSTQAFLDFWDQKQLLATFTDSNSMEIIVSQSEVQQIASTLPTMRLITKSNELYGQVAVPKKCFEDNSSNELPAGDGTQVTKGPWIDPRIVLAHKCSYDGKIYADGESWKPDDSSLECSTCSCKRGQVQCHSIVCPKVDCDDPISLVGECCPACPKLTDDVTKSCFFPGDHRNHAVGTVWHPFMHPGGFFQCVVCFCKEDGSGYSCKSTTCPKLDCPEHLQSKQDGECCASCTEPESLKVSNKQDMSRMQSDSNSYSSCQVGKKTYVTGETFHPEIGPFGRYENISCTCKNGTVECKKVKCDCKSRRARRNRCCMKQCGFTENDMIERKRKKTRKRRRFC